jgi:hypothetical protein
MFNKPEEGRVQSQMGPSLCRFTSARKENPMVFSYLESLKIFNKEYSTMDFFVNLVLRV